MRRAYATGRINQVAILRVDSFTGHRSQAVSIDRSRLLKCTFYWDVCASSQRGKEYFLASLVVPVHAWPVAVASSQLRRVALGTFAKQPNRVMQCESVRFTAQSKLVKVKHEWWIRSPDEECKPVQKWILISSLVNLILARNQLPGSTSKQKL